MNKALTLTPMGGDALPELRGERAAATADRLDFRSIWSVFRRRIGVFITIVALALLLALLFTLKQTPLYVAAAQISLNSQTNQIAPNSTTNGATQQVPPSSTYADTQVQVIASQDMAMRVVNALKLDQQARFREIPARPAQWFGLIAATPAIPLTPEQARANAAAYLQGHVMAQRVGETLALLVAFTDPDPVFAATMANEYARQYTHADVVDKKVQSKQSSQFLASRLEQLRGQAQADTEAVQRYRIANNLPSTSGANLTEQEISSYNQAVASARAQSAEDIARLNTARGQLARGSNGDDVGEALQSPVVTGLRGRQAELIAQLANLKANYGSLYPEVVKTQSQLDAINNQIEAEIKRIISNLEAKQRVSLQREGSLKGSLNQASGALAQNNRAMAGLDDLTRRASASQGLYESYLNRYKEVLAQEGTEQPNSRILSLANTPARPVSPRPMLNLALALVVGAGLGMAAALATELLYSGLTTGEDVESRLHVPYVGMIPTLKSVRKTKDTPLSTIVNDPRSPFAEAFRALRATLSFFDRRGAQVIAVASSLPKEGKTTTAICLARSYQLSGQSTVLVDCDLRRKGVSRLIGETHSQVGLLEVLLGTASLSDALIKEGSGLHVLVISGDDSDEAELLTGKPFDDLLATLRQRFARVILDTAPLLPIADARMVATKADAALLLVHWRKTPDNAVRAALRLLPPQDVNLVGVALTQVDMKKQVKYGYGDGEFHYGSYRSYYA